MSSGIGKLGSTAIKDSIKNVLNVIESTNRLKAKLADVVADKCPSNQEAIAFLQDKGVPVLYDLIYFYRIMLCFSHID